MNEKTLAQWGLSRQKQTNKQFTVAFWLSNNSLSDYLVCETTLCIALA
jgi:hypothetical protein